MLRAAGDDLEVSSVEDDLSVARPTRECVETHIRYLDAREALMLEEDAEEEEHSLRDNLDTVMVFRIRCNPTHRQEVFCSNSSREHTLPVYGAFREQVGRLGGVSRGVTILAVATIVIFSVLVRLPERGCSLPTGIHLTLWHVG